MSKNKGFLVYDALFSILILFLISSYILAFFHYYETKISSYLNSQILFNKLTTVSEYVVSSNDYNNDIYPYAYSRTNYITNNFLFKNYEQEFGKKLNIKLKINFEPEENMTCIYRLVVDNNKNIKKLYFCGDYGNNE